MEFWSLLRLLKKSQFASLKKEQAKWPGKGYFKVLQSLLALPKLSHKTF